MPSTWPKAPAFSRDSRPCCTRFEIDGLPWGVVTNKPGWLTDPLLQHLGLAQRACCVVSGDTVAERKPHPLPLLHAAGLAGVAPERCVYVGDAERDIVAGRAAGMQTVVAAYGYLGESDDPGTWNAHGIIVATRPGARLGDLAPSAGTR